MSETDISIEIDQKQLKELKKKLGNMESKAPTAMYRAINEAVKTARTQIDRKTREEYFVKRNFIFKSLDKDLARRNKLSTFIRSKGEAIPLSEFKTNPAKPNPKRKKAIGVSVKRDGETKYLGKNPKAFITILKGNKVVAERTSERRGPLKGLFGPAVPSVVKNEKVISSVKEEAQKKLAERLDHHVSQLLKG